MFGTSGSTWQAKPSAVSVDGNQVVIQGAADVTVPAGGTILLGIAILDTNIFEFDMGVGMIIPNSAGWPFTTRPSPARSTPGARSPTGSTKRRCRRG